MKISDVVRGTAIYVDPPYQVVPWRNPHDPSPVAAYQEDILGSILAPAIPKKGDPQSEPTLWFQKDSKGLPNYKTRLEATIQIRDELMGAVKNLESQIKQLEVLAKK
jgi:hypothetical protein